MGEENNSKNAEINEKEINLEKVEQLLFPHKEIRDIQDVLIKKVDEVIKNKTHLIAHAPTGLGKTAAALSPALTHILKPENKNLTIFFLTSRHTQHKIVIETLKKINDKFNLNIQGVSIIGKKHLCLQPNIDRLPSKEFTEFCKVLKEDNKCQFFSNMKKEGTLSIETEHTLSILKTQHQGISTTEDIIEKSVERALCPYEISMLLSKEARVIITDYHYIFNPDIRTNFFKRINKELKDCLIIVDEAHNLPSRVKDLASEFLSNITLRRAIAEAKKFHHDEILHELEQINDIFEKYAKGLIVDDGRNKNEIKVPTLASFTDASALTNNKFNNEFSTSEKYISKEDFIFQIKRIKDYDEFVSELVFIGNAIREEQQYSYVGSVANFLNAWLGQDEGFARILSTKKLKDKSDMITLAYRCLDPSIITAPVINSTHSTIMMSGTLTPTSMYKELFGIKSEELSLKSPFPHENRLNLIIPKTSTKYEARSQAQYQEIASVLSDVAENIAGNIAVYFPSYYLMNEVSNYFNTKTKKTIFTEMSEMSKSEKQDFLERFKTYKDKGAVLMAVISGSFGEGIDLPGILKAVIIVGLPLQKPDLETKALIDYYDGKFKKGWDYGYLFPAFTKTIQAAGRCIRSEHDKGVIIFLDERYTWNNYYRCFPATWNMKISLLYKENIRKFFS